MILKWWAHRAVRAKSMTNNSTKKNNKQQNIFKTLSLPHSLSKKILRINSTRTLIRLWKASITRYFYSSTQQIHLIRAHLWWPNYWPAMLFFYRYPFY